MKKNMKKIIGVILVIGIILVVLPNLIMSAYLSNLTSKSDVSKDAASGNSVISAEVSEQIGIVGETESEVYETKSLEEEEEIKEKYLFYLAPADDELDYLYANDYEYHDLVKLCKAKDTKAYGAVLGIDKKVTISDIEAILETNNSIDQKYKDFIIQYVKDWTMLYPESDFRVLYHNLKTLKIDVVSEHEMGMETQSTDSAACYLKQENRILLLEGQDFSRESDNYIILTHELTHCARSASYETEEDGFKRRIGYYDYYLMGTYAEEGIITNIAYEMQGLGKRADFYPFQSSCYRIIMDCTGYDAEDFMNHNVNYLMTMMDEYMGDEQYAWYIVALIDSISSQKYTPYQAVDFTEYQDLCDYITRMYMKKYLLEGMTTEEAEQVFEEYCDNIMYYFDKMSRPYPITIDNFRVPFEQCMQERGIE